MTRLEIDETAFVSEATLQQWCDRIGGAGFRGTGTAAHEGIIEWVEQSLRAIPGITIGADEYEILRWQPIPTGRLADAAALRVAGNTIAVAGVVPYTLPASNTAPLVYVPASETITADNAAGKVVLRDFPHLPLPYDALLGLGLHTTADCDELRGQIWTAPDSATASFTTTSSPPVQRAPPG